MFVVANLNLGKGGPMQYFKFQDRIIARLSVPENVWKIHNAISGGANIVL
jgi:hypothetical protein